MADAAPQEDAPLPAEGESYTATRVAMIDRLRAALAEQEVEVEFLRYCIDRLETYFDPDAVGIAGVPGRYPTFALAVEAARRARPDRRDTNRG